MKRISFNMISAIALIALTAGCSTTASTQNRESMLVASGFKVITPKTTAQQQKLQNLAPGRIAMLHKSGKTYYIFPDAAHNQAYVGGPKEYEAYKQMRAANAAAQQNVETVVVVQTGDMNYPGYMGWGGWGAGWGPMGMGMDRVGRF